MSECRYPKCKQDGEFRVREDMSLCEEHYHLWKFIDYLVWSAEVEINTRKSRFEKGTNSK